MDATQRARQRLAELEAAGLLRRSPAVAKRRGVHYELDGQPVVGFCSNDYLGLADDPSLRQASGAPSGSGSSRLICGDLGQHRAVELQLASLAGTADAVLFPSGFQLNVGVLPTLLEPNDRVDSDALNHASLIDGMRLARARPTIMPHGQVPAPGPTSTDAVHWWITESIFSMDGDRLDPEAARTHLGRGAAMLVDEAHAIGLFPGGHGWLGHHDIRPTVLVGTLSKAFGCAGAFVAASRPLCSLIRNRSRSFVFSTGMSPVLAVRIGRAVELVTSDRGEELRDRLWSNIQHLGRALDLPDPALPSPIVPIVVGDNGRALELASRLLERGWHVQAIRPPTVPMGTARLRLTVTAAHEPSQIDGLVGDLRALMKEQGLPLHIERGRAPTPEPTPVTHRTRRPA
ncbi:MAG: aminotransferase class I/II-fold pyridoxal phosphate-dependent enzyme [Deltaproteobacteria bacterium]|nr:aminotransferase class I/II-fold pyridoxal phosphate-dependent enzyme [Deltaproteobacteria bacterium]